ncbi:MAG: hypothetical protein ACTSWC_01470 [Promethearchaeota archaeon]
MKLWLRIVFALISAVVGYFFYIYVPGYIFDLLSRGEEYLTFVDINIGNYDQLEFYIKSVGFIIIGVNFAYGVAADKSKIKAIWRLCRLFLKIVFWGLFLFLDFNTIDISSNIITSSQLLINIDIEKVFYFTMGGAIFDIVLTVLDFFIAFFPEKTKEDK